MRKTRRSTQKTKINLVVRERDAAVSERDNAMSERDTALQRVKELEKMLEAR